MASAPDLTRLVPGFDFLQGLLKNGGGAMPGMGQWVAPTLNPQELEKRIQELKTVHFWLEQNAKLLATTIQAMEVQRMTLSTLQSMNLPLADLAESLKIKMPAPPPPAAPAPVAASAAAKPRKTTAPGAATAPPAVDPMQWWGALTEQFTELAAKAFKDGAAAPAASSAATGAAAAPKAPAKPRKAAARKRAR